VLIDVRNLDAGYGTRAVLRDINLQFESGIAGLLGPNGAGKSTLLKTIMGFLSPLAGQISVFDLPLPQSAMQVRSRIGYMPETESFIPGISTVQFVAYMARLSGLPEEAAMERAHEVLQYVGLGEARYRNLETYSLGMNQRAKLAQAIEHDPALLLLDEPTNGMDPEGRREMLELVDDLGHRKGMAIILCSHLLHDVESVADQVLVLGNGRVVSKEFRRKAGSSVASEQTATPTFYLVRLRGNAADFVRRLEQDEGLHARVRPDDGSVLVTFPPGTEADTAVLFKAAEQSDVLIRRMEESREGLEEIFVKAVGELGNAHL
jgi:ABC-2 type transport system ATP-binding protein